jgi:sigma-B regulation protein RsbU (phosphoserine phosphatase)
MGATGVPFGLDPEMPYGVAEVRLAPGDELFLFSDGITEAFDPADNEFGEERLEAALSAGAGTGAADLVGRVLAATRAFTRGADQSDDITCLALVFRGGAARP